MENFHFTPYHNRHIKFWLDTGEEFSGAVVLSTSQDKIAQDIYRYIPSRNMIEYNKACEEGNLKRMEELEFEIDARKIKSALLI